MASVTNTRIPLDDLREQIALALSAVKSYALPDACVNLGLAPGDGVEANQSKRLYVKKRLAHSSRQDLIVLGKHVAQEYPRYELEELLAKMAPESNLRVSEITRQNLFIEFGQLGDMFGKLSPSACLARVWPLRDMTVSGYDFRCSNLEEEVCQHLERNADWSCNDLFSVFKLDTVSDQRFVALLETLVDPLVRSGPDQDRYVEAINRHLKRDGIVLRATAQVSGYPVYKAVPLNEGVGGTAKNLIFAADGPKPEIVLADAVNNDIRIVRNEQHCLVYDLPIPSTGLLWMDLVRWWADKNQMDRDNVDTERHLYARLSRSLASPPEKLVFESYFRTFKTSLGTSLPALIPQVYLHYDPYTLRELPQGRLVRQRMDFLLLFSHFERVVIEVDGKQHYASDDGAADTKRYSDMVSADRDLSLAGYDIYRFGGHELSQAASSDVLARFFERLFSKYGVGA